MAEYFALAVRQISEYSGRSGGGYQEKPYDRSCRQQPSAKSPDNEMIVLGYVP